jgi:hypothetical protein
LKYIILIIFLFIIPTGIFADFGAAVSSDFVVSHNDDIGLGGSTVFAPWISLPIGNADFYLSAGITAGYGEETIILPELFRLEFSMQSLPSLGLRAGRIRWFDVTGFVANGFFDGATVNYNLDTISLSAALFYTGLLSRNSSNINISPGDPKNYYESFDWSRFTDTYFAPSHLFASLYGELPGIPHMRGQFHYGLLMQFDLSEAEKRLHNFYILINHTTYYRSFDLTASFIAAQNMNSSFAFSVEGGWQTGLLNDRLSLGLRWASGEGTYTAAFFPITTEVQGVVLRPWLSGIMLIRAKYEARLLPSLSGFFGARYFFRTDDITFTDQYLENDSYLIGLELDAEAIWVPFSDLAFSAVGGIFIPQTGRAMSSSAPVRWSITLGTIFSF